MLVLCQNVSAREKTAKPSKKDTLQCAAFSPYVDKLNPDYGAHPFKELIDELLDKLVKQTPFRCIMTYGVMNGLEHTFAVAESRYLKVIAIVWLDDVIAVNSKSITAGIEAARAYPKTIIKLSCGSELRTRHDYAFDGEISRCIAALREAGVSQPVTTIDTWWEWCNRTSPCHPTNFVGQFDWIGINVFPWWENKHSGVFPYTPAKKAADFHIARIEDIRRTYPGKEVILTEFGWPYAFEGGNDSNKLTRQQCNAAGKKNQELVLNQLSRNWLKKVGQA